MASSSENVELPRDEHHDPPPPNPSEEAGGEMEGEGKEDKTLGRAQELFDKGSKAIEEGDFVDAVDCLSHALEIRVAHCGELAPECASTYYKYGCALLYKAQEETDPLGNVPKSAPNEESAKSTSSKGDSESSKASGSNVEGASEKGDTEEGLILIPYGAGSLPTTAAETEVPCAEVDRVVPSPTGVVAAGASPAAVTGEGSSPFVPAKRPCLRLEPHRTPRGFVVAMGIGSLWDFDAHAEVPPARQDTTTSALERSTPAPSAEASVPREMTLPAGTCVIAIPPGAREACLRSSPSTTEASLIPEEDPLPEHGGPGAGDADAVRPNPADFVPLLEALRAWRGFVDDAATSVGHQVLQTYEAGRVMNRGQCSNGKDQEDGDGDNDKDDDEMEGDEDDSDLDLAWKMLDIARAIVEKSPDNTMEKVKIFSALAEVSMEREDIDNSLGDYFKALAILEHLVEPDHRRIVELNFRICLVFELASKIGDAIPYCAKAISLCKSRLQSLKNAKDVLLAGKDGNASAVEGGSEKSALEDEIELLTGILTELEKKLDDLEQAMSTPSSAIYEIMKRIASKASGEQNVANAVPRPASLTSSQMAGSSNGFDSSTLSTAASTGSTGSTVTDLGVVGRGIKRANIKPISAEPTKRLAEDSPSVKGDSSGNSDVHPTTQDGDDSASK